jgi:hypothetical protein
VLSSLKQVLREQRIGSILVAILFASGLLSFVSLVTRGSDLLTAYLYNQSIRDRMTAQADTTFGVVEADSLVTGILLIWAAALIYVWIEDSDSKLSEKRDLR